MKKLKPILRPVIFVSAALALTGAVALSIWVSSLDNQITSRLKTKTFLPPTEYYSSPLDFFAGMRAEELESQLKSRNYRLRETEQRLFPGDFFKLGREDCQKQLSEILPDTTELCLQFVIRESPDPDLSPPPLQVAAIGPDGKILSTYRGTPPKPSSDVVLEPTIVAQFLGDEPIMQTPLSLGEVPTTCLNAVLSIEDAQFLEHSGVSYTAIARAAFKNAFGRGVRQGGSTITQQLVKNYFLSNERTLKRKITEFFMSLILESHSSKDEILETYLNVIYLGQNGPFQIRGFAAASQYYFSKPIQQLNLGECSLLAAVVNSPGLFDPFRKPANATKRRQKVLDRMKELQFITADEHAVANAQPLPVNDRPSVVETAPYYINAVNKQIRNLGFESAGLRVFTGLTLKAQQSAQDSLRQHLDHLEKDNKKIAKLKEQGLTIEGLVLSSDNRSGLIRAAVGGRSFRLTQFNRAIDGHRQVGSIMKPFVFLTALLNSGENGKIYDPVTTLNDVKFSYKYENQTWSPENYGKKYYGQVPAYFALKNSLNAATASLGLEVGLEKIISVCRRLGIESDLNRVPALTLGAFELYPNEVLKAYSTLARMGRRIPLSFIRGLTDEKGAVLFRFQPEAEQAIEPEAVASLLSMMRQTVVNGTAKSIYQSGFTRPAAGKTGTTSDYKDAWFAGFTPFVSTVVWVGYDNNTPTGLTGASAPVPIWLDYMNNFGSRYPDTDFQWPEDVEFSKWTDVDENRSQEIELAFKKGAPHSH